MAKRQITTTSTKLVLLVLMMIMSAVTFSAQKLTTTAMRENSIRINALEINQVDITNIEQPKEMTIVLDARALNFDSDKSEVKEQYYPILTNLIEFIRQNNYNVTIVGHTDSVGRDKYNLALSLRRADSVKVKLIELGLEADRVLKTEGLGETNPVASNADEEGRFKNRRVEFKLVQRGN